MFGFRRKKQLTLDAIVKGEVIPLEEVQDNMFSTKVLGEGYAIHPTGTEVYAPVSGEVTTVFPTNHAVGIQSDSGVDVLVHLGIDTVELEGAPFTSFVQIGDKVTPQTKMIEMDLDQIRAAGKVTDCIAVVTTKDAIVDVTLEHVHEDVQTGTQIAEVKLNKKR